MTEVQLSVPTLQDDFKYHVFVAFSYKNEDIADSLTTYLRSRGLKVCICKECFDVGTPLIDNIFNSISQSRRTVMLLSQHYVNSDWFDYESLQIIHEEKRHQQHMLIPVIINLNQDEIPGRIKISELLYIQYNDVEPREMFTKIYNSCCGPDIPLSMSLPSNNICEGLVWGYFYGYLNIVLPSFRERFERSRFWNTDARTRTVCPMLMILIPESGMCYDRISDYDERFESDGQIEPAIVDRAGCEKRPYYAFVQKFTNTNKKYYACVEYATPLKVMYEMSADGRAHLDQFELLRQIKLFYQFLDRICTVVLTTEQSKSLCLIKYNDLGDRRCDLAKILCQKIHNYNKYEIREHMEKELLTP